MTDDSSLFGVPVPDEELAPPPFEVMPTAAYHTTLQAGATLVEKNGWTRLHLPFMGFTPAKNGGKTFETRKLEARFPVSGPSGDGAQKAVQIGRRNVVSAAAAFGLTEPVALEGGKQGQRLVAQSNEELVEQFNAVAGGRAEVYVVAKERERNGAVVQRNDGTGPVIDNEIRNVRAVATEGK